MKNDINKQPVFLIDMSRDKDYALFLEELGKANSDSTQRLSGYTFIEDETSCQKDRRKYLCISLLKKLIFWGGHSDIRPLGKHTAKYLPIEEKAITLEHFFEVQAVMEKADTTAAPQTYYVKINDDVREMLAKDCFDDRHRPYFAMKGSTHTVYTVKPFTREYIDAAPDDADYISAEEFISLYKECCEPDESMSFADYADYIKELRINGKTYDVALNNADEAPYYDVSEEKPEGIVTFAYGTSRICPKAFKKCCGITDVIFPDTLESIGSYAFAECMSIRRVYIPKSVKQIHCGAFHNCFGLVDVYYEGSENEWKALWGNDISDKSKNGQNGIAKFKNDELLSATIHYECKM